MFTFTLKKGLRGDVIHEGVLSHNQTGFLDRLTCASWLAKVQP